MRYFCIAYLMLAVVLPACAGSEKMENSGDKPVRVTFYAAGEKVSSLIERVAKQADQRMLMESTADVKISASVHDIPLEDALSAICKAGDLEWRKIYIRVDSPLLKKPDSLAATVRLMAGLQFPNLLIDKASVPESLVHVGEKPAVDAIPMSLRKGMGMVSAYLITNDKADKVAKAKADSPVEKYMKLMKDSLKLFMEMTPEEREQVMASGMQMVQQLDPKYMSEMTRTVLKMDPDTWGQLMQSSMNALFTMSPDDRRALMRMQMQSQNYMTPEQREILAEDVKVIMQEMGMTPPGEQPPQQ